MFDLAWPIILRCLRQARAINLFFAPSWGDRRAGYMASAAVALPSRSPPGTLCVWQACPPKSKSTPSPGRPEVAACPAAAALLIDPLSRPWPRGTPGVALIHVYLSPTWSTTNTTSASSSCLNFFFIFAMLILVLSDSFLGMFVL